MKKLAVWVLVVLGGVYLAKQTDAFHFASSVICKNTSRLKKQMELPREYDIEWVRGEIRSLGSDIDELLGPVAKKKRQIQKLEAEIKPAEATLAEQKAALLALTKDVKAGEQVITVANQSYSLEQARVKLTRDFEAYKRNEAYLAGQKELLKAQQANLDTALEQLNKMSEQKLDLEIRLTQLETRDEQLKLAGLKTPVRIDKNRVAAIKAKLDRIEDGLAEQEIRRQLLKDLDNKNNRPQAAVPSVEPAAVEAHFSAQPAPATKVAAGK